MIKECIKRFFFFLERYFYLCNSMNTGEHALSSVCPTEFYHIADTREYNEDYIDYDNTYNSVEKIWRGIVEFHQIDVHPHSSKNQEKYEAHIDSIYPGAFDNDYFFDLFVFEFIEEVPRVTHMKRTKYSFIYFSKGNHK